MLKMNILENGILPNTIVSKRDLETSGLKYIVYLIPGWDFDPVPDLRRTLKCCTEFGFHEIV